MNGSISITATALLMCATPATAQATYGDRLIATVAARHPAVSAITIVATNANGQALTIARRSRVRVSHTVMVPLLSGMGDVIGTVAVSSRRSGDVRTVADELSRRIYTVGVLAEAEPFAPRAVRSALGQALVEHAVDTVPGLVTLAMHVALPGHENMIVASNFGRIGKAADADDANVIADGAILREPTNGGRRLAVELPLRDRAGNTIGALSTSFLLAADRDADAAYAQAVMLRDDLASAIPASSSLAVP